MRVFPLTSHYQRGNMSVNTKKIHWKLFGLTKIIDTIVEMLKKRYERLYSDIVMESGC